MDNLRTIIHTLNEDDQKEFIYFIQRQGKKHKRKDVALFHLLKGKKELKLRHIQAKLYPEKANAAAYHALRKRLMRQLIDFIMLKRMGEDRTNASVIMGMISLSTYLFDQQINNLAWRYLKKAEKLALEHEHYDLLNNLYKLMIEYADKEEADDLYETIKKYEANKLLADEDERASMANSVIKLKLKEVRQKGKDLNFDRNIEEVLEAYQLKTAVHRRAGLFYKLMSIARSAVLVRKDYYAFETYIIEQFEQFEANVGFSPHHQEYRLELLYMIAHVLYRNKRFSESLEYLKQLETALDPKSKGLYIRFYARYILLQAANYTFLNRLDTAIQLLENLLSQPPFKLSIKTTLNARFNLGIYYTLRQDYRKAIKCSLEMTHSDTWMAKKMGKEWVVRKNLSELLLQYDLGNYQIVGQRLKHFRKKYTDMMELPEYSKAKIYLHFLQKLLDERETLSYIAFHEEIMNSFPFLTFEEEDIQEVFFYTWLKSKAAQLPYYEVLLDML